jgi:hypothetical protein
MEPPSNRAWFLRKHEDGSVFGPLSFEQLSVWASTAQVAPHDSLSIDQQSWIKAPMLPQLGMDWVVEVTSEHYYGPTTLGAIQEFFRLGEINEQTLIINTCDGTRYQLQEIPALRAKIPIARIKEESSGMETPGEPGASGIFIRFQERIRDLEETLREERRSLMEAEQRYGELERKYQELTERLRT